MSGPPPVVQHELTVGQRHLLKRHERGLRRLASELAHRNALEAVDIMFVLADRKGRIGRAFSAAVSIASVGPVVVPGRTAELAAWVEPLSVHGPVWDFTDGSAGIPVLVVDEHDAMAVVRLAEQSL
ncbi:MAG: hypothetical protein WDO69_33710 [Pseudomonadota bacterium]